MVIKLPYFYIYNFGIYHLCVNKNKKILYNNTYTNER